MEGAQALQRTAAGAAERHVLADHIVDPASFTHQRDVTVPDSACHNDPV
jgi:hypothetical protein